MTVQKELTKNIYVGNGQTTKFPFTFECPDNHPEYIRVYVAGKKNELTETTNFGVDMANKSITYPANGEPLAIDEQLVIMRELPVRQLMNLVNNGPYFAEDIETAFDEGIMIAQQSSEKLGRALVAPPTSTTFDTQIPIEPGKTFRVSDDGTHLQATEDPGKVIDEAKAIKGETETIKGEAEAARDTTIANKDIAVEAAKEAKQVVDNLQITGESTAQAKKSAEAALSSEKNAKASEEVVNTKAEDVTNKHDDVVTKHSDVVMKAEQVATDADNAKKSADTADGIATQLTEYLKTKENLTAPTVDKSLLIEGAAADSKVVGENIGELKKDLYIKTYNIFDVDFLPRAFIALTGSHKGQIYLDNNDNYSATNETIEVSENVKYTLLNGNKSLLYSLGISVVMYDNNMNYLNNSTYEFTNTKKYFTFTTSENTKYLRIMCRATGKGTDIPNIKKWQLNEGDVRPYLKPYEVYVSSNYIGEELTNADITNPQVKSFIENVDYSGQDYTITQVGKYSAPPAYYRKDCCFPMVVKWKSNNEVKNQVLYISKTSGIDILDNVNTKKYDVACGTSDFCVYNLIPNKKYYYKICGIDFHNNPIIIKKDSFTTSGSSRMLNIDGLKNVRDLGGWSIGRSGFVKYGLLFRGCELDDTGGSVGLTSEGKKELFERIGIRVDIDLRTNVGNTKSPIGARVEYSCYPIEPYDVGLKKSTTQLLIKSIFELIENKLSTGTPIYFHCQGGRDRTGTLAFLILGTLGVSESDIAKDYELTEFAYPNYLQDSPNTSRKVQQYVDMVNYIKAFEGETISDKIIDYLLSIGVSQTTIDNIKTYMISNS